MSILNIWGDDPYPINPLREKWTAEYPKYDCKTDGYKCMFCGDCTNGDYWKCPEEDLDIYQKYLDELDAWKDRHPNWCKELTEYWNTVSLESLIEKE